MTITDVSKAFSTIMYGKYRRREISRDMNREEFLAWLAEMMKTSGDMLNNVYLADAEDNEWTTRLADFLADRIGPSTGVSAKAAVAVAATADDRAMQPQSHLQLQGKKYGQAGHDEQDQDTEDDESY